MTSKARPGTPFSEPDALGTLVCPRERLRGAIRTLSGFARLFLAGLEHSNPGEAQAGQRARLSPQIPSCPLHFKLSLFL